MSTAYLFPGQGSQNVGMGRSLFESSAAARATFAEADEVLGYGLSALCFEGPEDELTATWNAQPALLLTSVAALRAGIVDGLWNPPLSGPSFVAGHSLGEYSALVAVGSLEFADALRLVRRRGELMHACGLSEPSTMAAVLGLDAETVGDICRETGAEIANLNAPGQVGIAGTVVAVERASALAKARGARRVLPLNVSAAFHSSVMAPAANGLRSALDGVLFRDSAVPLITNTTAETIHERDAIRNELVDQLCRPVLWQLTIERLASLGVTRLLEIGTGTVLCGLAKRIAPDLEAFNPVEQALGKGRS